MTTTAKSESVKSWLWRYQDTARDSETLECRIEALRGRLEAPGSSRLDGMPRAPGYGSDRIGAALAQLEEMETEVRELRGRARTLYQERDSTIQRIGGPGWPDLRAVLRLRYLDGAAWLEVAQVLFGASPGYDERQDSFLRRVHKLHAAALTALTELTEAVPLEQGQENEQEEKDNEHF